MGLIQAPGKSAKFALNSFEAVLFYSFLAINAALIGHIFLRPARAQLTMDMAASKTSYAQLFYDVGHGFNEQDSATVPVTSNSLSSFQHLSFPLPEKTVVALRFDPLTTDGRVILRNVRIEARNKVLRAYTASEIKAFHQIANRSERDGEAEFSTLPGADDPGLTIVTEPIRLRGVVTSKDVLRLLGIDILLACACFLIRAMRRQAFSLAKALLELAQPLAARVPEDSFLNVDAFAVFVYASLIACFLLAALLDLNGSSAGLFKTYGNGAAAKIWLGTPKGLRSDEWAYSTPASLNQYFRADRFAVRDSVLGNHNIDLTGNVPVRHVATLFRPQFWSYFILPADYAYAIYWQMKGLVLLGGVFTFLLLLTRSSRWALTGALWYFVSPFIEWSYSWPSAMPEMVGSLCLGIVCFCYLTTGRRLRWLVISAMGTALCGVNFVMCAYLPHLVPLIWVGVPAALAWLVARRADVFRKEGRRQRIVAILLTVLVLMGVGWIVYRDLKLAIAAVSATLYPGRRVWPGGSLPLWEFASHFLPWTENENAFPAALGNLCEGSGFLWLAPFTLLCFPRLSLPSFGKAALAALWISFAAIFCWCAFPLSAQFGRMTGMDVSGGARCLPALGLANIAIVIVTMAGLKKKSKPLNRRPYLKQAAYLLFGWVLWMVILANANQHLAGFFGKTEIVLAALFASFLITLLLTGESRLLALALVVPQALAFGLVNPVERGIPEYTQSDLNRFVQGHRELLQGRWLVYSDTPVRSGFIAAAGCEVYTGTRYLPDIDHFPDFAKRGLDLNIFNRLGYLDAHAILPNEPVRFVQVDPVIVEWDVAPSDPLLKTVGIRYVAFDAKPNSKLTEGLTAVNTVPVDGLWIYRLGG